MKNEYLQHLLKENKTVIIPGLGAFVANESQTMPLLFNEYLKFDDGLVVGYISKTENSSKEDAGKKLEVFVSGIKSLLDSGRDVVFTGLGKLKKDAAGKLVFTYDATIKSEQIVNEKKIETPVTPPKEETIKPVVKEEPLVKPKDNAPKIEEVKPVTKPTAEKTTNDKKNTAEKSKPTKEKKEKPRKKKRLVLFLILFIILGGGATAGFIFKDQLMAFFKPTATVEEYKSQVEDKKTEQDTIITEEPIVEDSSLTNSPTEEPIVEETPVVVEEKKKVEPVKTEVKSNSNVSAESGTFYVIIGCYSSDFNAENMILKANSKGLNASNIGSFGGLMYVSAFSGSTLEEATSKLNEIKGEFPKAWVFKKR